MSIHLKTVLYKAVLLSMALGLFGFSIALAASGGLDTTFSGDGKVVTKLVPSNPGRWNQMTGIALLPNGKIVVAGFSYATSVENSDFALARYTANGALDPTFSGDGVLLTNFGAFDRAYSVAVQPDGRIVVAGTTYINGQYDLALARYKPSGALDTTFSGDGKVVTDFQGRDNGSFGGLAIQPDGKIVVAGYVMKDDFDFAIYRYNSNGTLDTTFSLDGRSVGNFGPGKSDYTYDLAIQGDGKIVAVGQTGGGLEFNDFAIVRLNPNGSVDPSFSGDGRQTTNFANLDTANAVALQPDGKIVVVGSRCGSSCTFAIARYTPNGSLDPTFDGDGKKTFALGTNSYAKDVVVTPDGKIVVTGLYGISPSVPSKFPVVRLLPSGAFDSSFGSASNGRAWIGFGGFGVTAYGAVIARQPVDGKYVVGGYVLTSTDSADFGLARVLP